MTAISSELQVMGVMNITPDSFSDGGKLYSGGSAQVACAVDAAAAMVAEGVHWLDVGGESTRPGAAPVSVEEELQRVIPVVEALSARFATPISVDTSQPQVIASASSAGASMVNDVRALQIEGALQQASESGLAVCLMHMQGDPQTMQQRPAYASVIDEVLEFLRDRVAAAEAAGIPAENICLDPGFGFGKSLEHNLQMLNQLPLFVELGYPLLVGFSRKSMIGAMTGRDAVERDNGTTILNTLALQKGARILRVHNVAAAADLLKIWQAVSKAS